MTVYILKIMGPVSLSRLDENGAVSRIRLSRTSQGLLAYLAINGSKAPVSREAVAEALWPEAPPAKSRNSLSTALWRLKGALGAHDDDGPFSDRGGWMAIEHGSDVSVDVHELAARTRALTLSEMDKWDTADVAALETAISARCGAFLDGVEGEWVYAARQICADIYEAGLEALILFHRHRGNLSGSIDAARRLVSDDPYREDIQAMLVELYAMRGQRGRAIAQYMNCRDLLRSDLGVGPGDALRASLDDALGRQGLVNPELQQLVQSMNRTIGLLARHVDDLRTLLSER